MAESEKYVQFEGVVSKEDIQKRKYLEAS